MNEGKETEEEEKEEEKEEGEEEERDIEKKDTEGGGGNYIIHRIPQKDKHICWCLSGCLGT